MKKLQYLFFGAMATLLMAADCSNKDSEFYNDVFVSSQNLVDVEDQASFAVDDIIWVNTNSFQRYIPENGKPNLLDVFTTSGGAQTFTFSYLLERKNSNDEWSLVTIQDADVRRDLGITTTYEEFVQAESVFDVELQSYEYRGGIRLNQAGEYRLSFTYNSGNQNTVVLTSGSTGNNLFVNINSTCEDISDSGYYFFTVN